MSCALQLMSRADCRGVNHPLRGHSLPIGQPGMAERRRHSAHDHGRRQVLRVPAWVRTHVLFLRRGGRQKTLRHDLQTRFAERLDPGGEHTRDDAVDGTP